MDTHSPGTPDLWKNGTPVVIPIGIPSGHYVCAEGAKGPNGLTEWFTVRKGREWIMYPAANYVLWTKAWRVLPKERLVGLVASELGMAKEEVGRGVEGMVEEGILIALSGDWEADWSLIRELRPMPRAVAVGNDVDSLQDFAISSVKWTVWVDFLDFSIWTHWDGTVTLDEVATAVATGLPEEPGIVKEKAHRLLINGLRGEMVFVDAPPRAGGGDGA